MAWPGLDIRRKFGYGLSVVKEFLNGFDNGTGYFKLPLYFLGMTVALFLAPYLLAVALSVGLIYAIKAYFEERENIEKERQKLAKLKKLEDTLFQQELEFEKYKNNNNLHLNAFGFNVSDKEILLFYLLQNYLDYYENHSDKKYNGKVPGQGKILKLLSQHLKLPVNHPEFKIKAQQLLNKHTHPQKSYPLLLQFESFYAGVMANNAIQPEQKISSVQRVFNSTINFIKNRKKIRKVGKAVIDFISDSSTGMGIALGLLILFGVVSAAIPVTIPVYLGIIGAGIAFAGLTAVYNQYVAKNRKQSLKKLDKEIESKEQKILIAKQLNKLQRRRANNIDEKSKLLIKAGYTFAHGDKFDTEIKNKYSVHKIPPLPKNYKTQAFFGLFAQGLNGIALGLIIGLSIAWIASVLIVGFPYLLPALVIGGVFAGICVYNNLKQESKKIQKEITSINEIAKLEQDLDHYVGQERVHTISHHQDNTPKSNRILLKHLIESYLNYLHAIKEPLKKNAKTVMTQDGKSVEAKKLRKQEKILRLIEQTAKIERPDNNRLGDAIFYDSLAKYLKGNNKNSTDSNLLVEQLKKKVYESSGQKASKVDAENPLLTPTLTTKQKVISKLKSFGKFMRNYGLPFIGAVSLGLMLPIFLAGPHAFVIIGIVAAVVISAFVIQKVVEKRAEKTQEQLEDKKTRLSLIARTAKLEDGANLKKAEKPLVLAEKKIVEDANKNENLRGNRYARRFFDKNNNAHQEEVYSLNDNTYYQKFLKK